MHLLLIDIVTLVLSLVVTAPIWLTIFWVIWQQNIRPLLVPAVQIDILADQLLKEYSAGAAQVAFDNEVRACRSLETFEQAKWRRVRKAILYRSAGER